MSKDGILTDEQARKIKEEMIELEKISQYYSQLQYLLKELLENPDPNEVLASILKEIKTLVGGEPSLLIKYDSGLWEKFSLDCFKKNRRWCNPMDFDSELYEIALELGEITWVKANEECHVDKNLEELLREDGRNSTVMLALTGDTPIVLDVRDVITPEYSSKYLEAINSFFTPLVLSVKQSALLQGFQKEKEKSDLLLELLFHDIRGFIGNIQISLELLQYKWNGTPDLLKFLNDANEQTGAANDLLERVRKVLMMKSRRDEFEPRLLVALVKRGIELATLQFLRKNLMISMDIDKDYQDIEVEGDELLIEVFVNIISNAIKYTEKTEKRVQIDVGPWESQKEYVLIKITDWGIGIPDTEKPSVFGKFTTESSKGIGLGLNLSLRVIENNHGYFWFENRVPDDHKQGTIVCIALPIHQS